MPGCLVAVDQALVDHAVDDGRGGLECGSRFSLLARLHCQGGFADGAAQARGRCIVPGAVNHGLACGFFSGFGIGQGKAPEKSAAYSPQSIGGCQSPVLSNEV